MIGPALAFAAGAFGTAGAGLLALSLLGRRGDTRDARWVRRLAAAGARLRNVPAPRDLESRLDAAGRPAGLGPRELMAAKLAAAVAGAGCGLVLAAGAPGRLGPLVATVSPVAGFLAPDLWLARVAAARGRSARRELAPLLDLLRVTVEAGASLPEALRSVGREGRGALAAEWRAAGRRVGLGAPLGVALDESCRRLPIPELRALVAALGRSTRHGTPLADTLAAQARDARAALTRAAREHAARAGPKIQLVVALLLVPSVLLLVAAALLGALLDSGGTLVPV